MFCPKDILQGSAITKTVRHSFFGTKTSSGANSMLSENFQRAKIIEGTGHPCCKTNMRINSRTYQLVNCSKPNTKTDGYDYSEDFDGIQEFPNGIKIYINLKCIVGKGGSQTRSLKECYEFMKGQLHYLLTNKDSIGTVLFANIFDGDESHAAMGKFNYLLNLPEYREVKNNIYVGDLKDYFMFASERSGIPMADQPTEHPDVQLCSAQSNM